MLVMKRTYKTGTKNDVKVFSGVEIEHTPAFGLQTLFLARNDLTFDQIHASTTNYEIFRTWLLCNSRLSI